ncbi:MAG: septal ring lytic transglycosylase RlpA family protein [Pseudomonadota bacterium]
MKMTGSRALGTALTGVAVAILVGAGTAHADRKGAPITYANADNAPKPQTQSPTVVSPSSATLNANRRVEFQYPTSGAPDSTPVIVGNQAPVPQPDLAFNPVQAASLDPIVNTQPIRIASVQTQRTARTGQPLTLSRVKADRAATIREERGLAGIYMDGFEGHPTANGEIFDETAMTAAHPSLPLPSLVQVINEDNSREIVVRVNDRGPFDGKRILELSPRAATVLGMTEGGSANVKLRYLGPAPVQQNPETYETQTMTAESLPPVVAPLPSTRSAPQIAQAAPVPSPAAPIKVASVSVVRAQPAGNIFIQAGAFSDIANAQRLTTNIGGGLPVKIEEARVNGGDFFRVLVGPFPNRDMAERERAGLSNAGIVDGFITTR